MLGFLVRFKVKKKPTVTKDDFKNLPKTERGSALRSALKRNKRARQAEREKLREALGDDAPAKEVPKTIESTREYDETMVQENDDEVEHDEAHDEFAQYFNRETTPKVLITMSPFAKKMTWKFCFELHKCIPSSEIFSRKGVPLKKVVKQAISKNYTDLLVVHEDQKKPNGIIFCHLPEGPTAYFKINSLKFSKDIPRCGESSAHNPEIVLNNFNTRLGHSIARMFACLFPHDPKFTGRRVVTFHNQRDYIFFRHHRYEFKKEGQKAALLELGPRFTLRLKWLQKGTFNTKWGEYEWVLKVRLLYCFYNEIMQLLRRFSYFLYSLGLTDGRGYKGDVNSTLNLIFIIANWCGNFFSKINRL
ncbi:Ribosome production factor [Trichostrongylus colubriformis]|uniref:Ribosome production factor n=1 Tax=Trichostrongylus colubriformis TaxID=6319 RepID=A0AAN8F628_TRICO